MEGTGLLAPPPPPPLPPPQLGTTARSATSIKTRRIRTRRRDRGTPMNHAPSNRNDPAIRHGVARSAFDARWRDCPIAVVVTVSVAVTLPVLERLICAGLKLHVVSAGSPEHAKLPTVPESAFMLDMLRITFSDCPAVTWTSPWGINMKSGMLMNAGALVEGKSLSPLCRTVIGAR